MVRSKADESFELILFAHNWHVQDRKISVFQFLYLISSCVFVLTALNVAAMSTDHCNAMICTMRKRHCMQGEEQVRKAEKHLNLTKTIQDESEDKNDSGIVVK